MKKTVPFTKEIDFKTMISKVTTISLEHTLKPMDDNTISGHFIIEGNYKMTLASQIDEEFSYKIPVDIEIDKKYDISDIVLDIEDFTYEVVDEEKLVLNITVSIDNIKEVEQDLEDHIEIIDEDRNDEKLVDGFLEKFEEHDLEIPTNDEDCYDEEINIENDNNEVDSLFSSFKDSVETFKTYSVYIVKEEDTLNSIMQKYNIDKESLEEYNDLSNFVTGSKIVIPSLKNE